MVPLDKFASAFKDFADDYVIIGGTALAEISRKNNLVPRATKDLDLIVLASLKRGDFMRRLIAFAQEAGYEEMTRSSDFCSYRLSDPKDRSFPAAIELFCFDQALGQNLSVHLAHLAVSDEVSFSAIMLEPHYREFIEAHVQKETISYLDEEAMIPLKAKAYLGNRSLYRQKAPGISLEKVRKHGRDIIRLSTLLDNAHPCFLSQPIYQDLFAAIALMKTDGFDVTQIGDYPFFDFFADQVNVHYRLATKS